VKSSSASCEAKSSLISASDEFCKVSVYEATSALLRAQPRFSREAKRKAPISAKSEASPSAEVTLSYEARVEAPFDANSEVTEQYSMVLKH